MLSLTTLFIISLEFRCYTSMFQFNSRKTDIISFETDLLKRSLRLFGVGHASLTDAELEALLGVDASNRVKEAYLYLYGLFDRVVANNAEYYEMIEQSQDDNNLSLALLHSNYEAKYNALIASYGFDKNLQDISSTFKKKEFLLNIEVNST